MPTNPNPASGGLARSASAEIRAEMARQRVTGQELARRIDRSQNYVAKRLRDEVPLTLNDLEAVGAALHLPFGKLMKRVAERAAEGGDQQ